MKAGTLFMMVMSVAIFAATTMAIADVSTTLDSPIKNLYQEIISARSFASIQDGAIESSSAGDKVRFQPILTDINVSPGWVKCYAAYVEGDKLYIAQQGSDNRIVFKPYNGEAEIPYYDTEYFYGGTWTPNAYFETLGDSFEINNRTFIFGIAPKSVSSIQDFLDNFYGQWISLTKGTGTVTPSDGGTTGGTTSATTNKPSDQMLCFLSGGQWMADLKCVGGTAMSDQTYCEKIVGGKWENNQCTSSQTTKSVEPLFCTFSGGVWNSTTNTCTVTPGKPYPSPVTPQATPTPTPAASCQAIGGLWVNNQCLMPGTDTDKIVCVSDGGTWVNNKCENSHSLCTANGGTWDDTTQKCYTAQQACSISGGTWQNNKCYTQAEWCVASGGTWSTTDSRCITKAELNCLPPNVWQNNACYTQQAACTQSGQFWANGVCYTDAATACAALAGVWDATTSTCYSHCIPPQVWEPITQLCYANQTLANQAAAQANCTASGQFWSTITMACYPTAAQQTCAETAGSVWSSVNNTCYASMLDYCTAIGKTYNAVTNTCN